MYTLTGKAHPSYTVCYSWHHLSLFLLPSFVAPSSVKIQIYFALPIITKSTFSLLFIDSSRSDWRSSISLARVLHLSLAICRFTFSVFLSLIAFSCISFDVFNSFRMVTKDAVATGQLNCLFSFLIVFSKLY